MVGDVINKKWMRLGLALATVVSVGLVGGCKSSEEQSGSTGTDTKTSSGSTAATGDTIKIGVVASLSGDQKPWGEDSKDGAQMAVEEFNAAGGFNGKKIELKVEDSASKPEVAKTAAVKLISDNVIAIVGEVASGHTEQIALATKETGIPVVAIGATRTDLTKGRDNVARVCYVDDFQGPVMAKFAYEEEGIRKVAIITDVKQPYSQGLSESFKQYFLKLGGEVVAELSYQSGDTQFQSQLTELKQKAPQGIFLSGYFTEVGPLAAQARAAGITAKLFGGDGWDSTQILQSGGDAIIGSFLCNHYNNKEDRKEIKDFLEKWKAKHDGKEPGTTMAALGYDAMNLTLDALKRATEMSPKALNEAVQNTENFSGVTGVISLKGHHGNPPKRALVVEVRPMSEGFQVFRKAYDYFESK
jgi:branched-chain amino acid transport system substrate-binding protein